VRFEHIDTARRRSLRQLLGPRPNGLSVRLDGKRKNDKHNRRGSQAPPDAAAFPGLEDEPEGNKGQGDGRDRGKGLLKEEPFPKRSGWQFGRLDNVEGCLHSPTFDTGTEAIGMQL